MVYSATTKLQTNKMIEKEDGRVLTTFIHGAFTLILHQLHTVS